METSAFTLLKFVHLIAASLWLGGILFTVIVNRGLRRYMPAVEVTGLIAVMGRAMQGAQRASLYTAIATGPLLLAARGIGPELLINPPFYSTSIGSSLLAKVIAVALLLAFIPLHSRYGALLSESRDASSFRRNRARLLAVGWGSLALTLSLFLLGTVIRLT